MAGIDVAFASGSVYNNIIFDNDRSGIRGSTPKLEIVSNTITANELAGIVIEDPQGQAEIKNNIVAHNGDTGIKSAGSEYSYNLLFANNKTADCNPAYLWCVRRQFSGHQDEKSYLELRNIIADPLFVDPAGRDFHLLPGSPAIDGGDPDPACNDVHFGPSMGSFINDIGAYGGPWTLPEERRFNLPPLAFAGIGQGGAAGSSAMLADRGMSGNPDRGPGPDIVRRFDTGNRPPLSKISPIISVIRAGDQVEVSGALSRDPDEDPLTCKWEISFKPIGSGAMLADHASLATTLLTDMPGCYLVRLTVDDGELQDTVDSQPLCTTDQATDGRRVVPDAYPTIQAAIDSAEPGDQVVVRKGSYQENVTLDENVDLIGLDWPVIDGGSKPGNHDTLLIFGVGPPAGKVEGFIITGGGQGPLGHGVKIWNASPEVSGNIIMRNGFIGLGIHGQEILTRKTKIFNNTICENRVGIGNGMGGIGHIFDNRIFRNDIVGIGARGLAAPRIEGNDIYENHIGLGMREAASFYAMNNNIYNNVLGVAISPTSSGLQSDLPDFGPYNIILMNNLLLNNAQAGIFVSSFNQTTVLLAGNSIEVNKDGQGARGGGVLLGYPLPGSFTVVMDNNLITGNRAGPVRNYSGSKLFPAQGATVIDKASTSE